MAGMAATLLPGCSAFTGTAEPDQPRVTDPHLTARVASTQQPGMVVKGETSIIYASANQDALLYLPTSYDPGTPAPLVLMLHGAGGVAIGPINLFQPYADAAGLVLLSVDSLGPTWDMIYVGSYGADVTFINASLQAAFNTVNVDPTRVYVEGFSDGASYALALALSNGDLFSHAVIFSAGFIPPYVARGKPRFFESHGVNDTALPIAGAGRVISRQLTTGGYDVDYVEFDGVHEVPAPVAQQAIAWLAA